MTAFEDFTLYFALSLAQNDATNATLKISNTDGIKLVYCIPNEFTKRVTDTSNALAIDKTEPDTGSGRINVELQITQSRETEPTTNVLEILNEMFFNKSNDEDFRKGRFGLLCDDNVELEIEPVKFAGYKFAGFRQIPNKDNPALQAFNISLTFVGDHTKLGEVSSNG